jgi:hypothetical protein
MSHHPPRPKNTGAGAARTCPYRPLLCGPVRSASQNGRSTVPRVPIRNALYPRGTGTGTCTPSLGKKQKIAVSFAVAAHCPPSDAIPAIDSFILFWEHRH